MEINEKFIEELGFKAERKGVFCEWQTLTTKLKEEKGISLNSAAEMAFDKLMECKNVNRFIKIKNPTKNRD